VGRDAAQISRDIDQARADLATTLIAIRSTDVKGGVTSKADEIRTLAVAKAKHKAQELQPMLRARAQSKADEVKALALTRGRQKIHELRPVALSRVQELKPVAIARARDKAAEVTPMLAASAKAKVEEIKPIALARANATAEQLKSKARSLALAKVGEAKGAAATSAADLGGRALELASSRRSLGAAGGALAAGLALVVTRRKLRKRSRTRLQRVVAQADVVNREAVQRIHRARGRAAEGLHQGVETPKRLRRRMRRG
jgi:hypothetical protein